MIQKHKKPLTLEETQLAGLEVLEKLKEIFDAHGWHYYLAFGSLIGAIRHKDFIPWDDDIDVFVPRPDYEAFIEYCKEQNPSLYPFRFFHYSLDNYPYGLAKLSDTRYTSEQYERDSLGVGVYVDIFPLDGAAPSDASQKKRISFLIRLLTAKNLTRIHHDYPRLQRLAKILLIHLAHLIPVSKLYLCKRIDSLAKKHPYESSDRVWSIAWDACDAYPFDKKLFEPLEVTFHGQKFTVPSGYDEILRTTYGDYMKLPPKSQRVSKHYCDFYKKPQK